MSTWPGSLGAPWPLDNPLACADAKVESSEIPKHAAPTKLDIVKKLETTALNVEVAPPKRAYASGILIKTYASLLLSEVQTLRILDANEDSAYGKPQ